MFAKKLHRLDEGDSLVTGIHNNPTTAYSKYCDAFKISTQQSDRQESLVGIGEELAKRIALEQLKIKDSSTFFFSSIHKL
uniref:Uncharacterized protein n=1 Tax=Physcomitrium patens TaxID=3218 RepID=A0A2K1KTL4_PHYPA|nr:hypothetical protein PHYPA_004101 [Physcomitrium patens]